MNIIKKKIFIPIIILIMTIKSIYASNIINNKNISLKLNGTINNSYLLNKKNNYNNIISLIIKGKIKKNKNINTFIKLEEIIKTNISNKKVKDNFLNNISYIGINHNKIGKISYGKNYENLYNTLFYTYDLLKSNKSKIISNNTITGISNNLITYSKNIKLKNNPILKNIKIIGQYQIRNKLNNIKSSKNGLGFTYKLLTKNGIEFSTSYSKKKYDEKIIKKYNINNNLLTMNNAWSTGIKYKTNNLYLGTTYTEGKNINKSLNKNNLISNINILIKYKLKKGLNSTLGYVQTISSFKNINKDIEKYFNIGTTYKFNKSFNAYIDYKIDKIKNNLNTKKNDNDDLLLIGFIYNF